MARDRYGEAGVDAVPAALRAAESLASEHARSLLQIYDQIRQTHQGYLNRLRDVEQQIDALAGQYAQASAGQEASDDPRRLLDLLRLEDQLRPLRQQQEWLGEQLVLLASAGRKIQAVAHQAQLAASYLGGNPAEGGGISDLTELAELHMLQAQEEERRRLARDVHDGPAQVLANAVFGLEWCKRMLDRDPAQLAAELENIENELRHGLDDVRQFIFDLSPASFTELGLIATLRSYLQKFSNRTGILTTLDAEPDLERTNPPVEIGVFRIVQEALQNVRKHSRARRVDVSVSRRDATLQIEIRDDGVGFDRASVPGGGTHFGLVSMAERARLLRGELTIESAPGFGTRLLLVVPVGEPARDL